MQSMVTTGEDRSLKAGSRRRTYRGHRISRLQQTTGSNDRGYDKACFIITVPKDFCKDLQLQRGDVFAWDIIKEHPPTMTLTKLTMPNTGDSA